MTVLTKNETGCIVSTSHITGDVVCQRPGPHCDCLMVAADAPAFREARVYSNWSENRDPQEQVAVYLPANYEVCGWGSDPERGFYVVIGGHDDCGWTLEDHVIPRLASGLYFAEEVELDA